MYSSYTDGMDVDFSPELEAQLNRKAAHEGRDTESLVHEAVERYLDYDEWFIREVEKVWHKRSGANYWSTKTSERASKSCLPKSGIGLDPASLDSCC